MSETSANNKRIAKNSIFLYLRMFFAVVVNLYASRLLLDNLGIDNYGIYNIVGGVVALMMFVNSAMQTATTRFITFSLGSNILADIKSTTNAAIHIHAWIMLLLLVVGETFGLWFVMNKLNVPAGCENSVFWVYQFSVLSSCIAVLQVPFSSLLISYEKMDMYAYIEILNVISRCVIIFFLPLFFNKLIGYAILLFLVSVIVFVLYFVYAKKKIEGYSCSRKMSLSLAKPMITFASWSLFSNGTYAISRQGTNILINNFFGVAANAAGGIATQASSIISQFVANVQSAFNPQIIKSYSSGDISRMNSLMSRECEIMVFLSSLVFTPLYLNMDFIMHLWLKEVPEYAVIFCKILLICNLVQMITNIEAVAIQATGRNKQFSFITGCINILCVLLVYVGFKIGLDAPSAYAMYFIAFIAKVLVEAILVNQYIKELSIYTILLSTMKPMLILFFSILITYQVYRLFNVYWIALLVSILINGLVMSLSFYFIYPRYRSIINITCKKLNKYVKI